MNSDKRPAFLAALLMIGISSGCNQGTPPPEVGSHSISGNFGEMHYHAEFAQWGSGSAFIIIADLTGPSQSGASWRPAGAFWNGRFSIEDGKSIVWECSSADGKTGHLKIDGNNYELADGSFLWIALEGDAVVVRQFKRDTLTMAPNQATLELLFKEPEVRQLIGDRTPREQE